MATVKGTTVKIQVTGRLAKDIQLVDNERKYLLDICITESVKDGTGYKEIPVYYSAFLPVEMLSEKQVELYKQGAMIWVHGDYGDAIYQGEEKISINRVISAKDIEFKFPKKIEEK